jgi:DNA (cytosine-5)-methyltransferase 1
MRDATADEFPRYAVWENVPGAFSSHNGKDFKAVLEAFCEITTGGGITIPFPQGRRWKPAGCVVGDGYSIAWRVYDAQYWGVPQRRKRIYLIADFRSERAGETLFESDSLRRDSEAGEGTGERTSSNVEGSTGRGDQVKCLNPWDPEGKRIFRIDGATQTLFASECGGGHLRGICYAIDCRNLYLNEEKSATLQAHKGSGFSLNFINPIFCLNDQGGK